MQHNRTYTLALLYALLITRNIYSNSIRPDELDDIGTNE